MHTIADWGPTTRLASDAGLGTRAVLYVGQVVDAGIGLCIQLVPVMPDVWVVVA